MFREFPNQLNQQKVIQLANSVVLDSSITFGSNHHEGQSGDQGCSTMFGQAEFPNHQNIGHIQQRYLDGNCQERAILPYYDSRYPYCRYIAYWCY